MGIFDKGVTKTNRGFFERLSRAIVGKAQVDEDLLDAIEEALLATDMGVDTTMKIIENLEERVRRDKYVSLNELVDILRDEIASLLNLKDGETKEIKADSVILSVGYNPAPIGKKSKHVHIIGDAANVGNLRTVIWGAWDVAMKI